MESLCGYVPNPAAVAKFMEEGRGQLLQSAPPLPSAKGKAAFLFEIERQLTGKVRPPHAQTIGDCVSHGFTGASEDVQFVQMLKNPTLQFKWLSSEAIYGLARVQIGQGQCGRGDGAVVAWALEAGQKFGLLPRATYGQYNLGNYNGSTAHSFGASGCPAELLAIAATHKTTSCYLIEGAQKYEQARDAIASGGAIVTGSNQLYSNSRDNDGFCTRSGHGGHCTYYRGFADQPKRPGIVYQQSWGPQIPSQGEQTVTLESGQTVILPPGAFFIDASEFDRMHSGSDSEVWVILSEDGWLAPDDQLGFHFY
jgi:hypothetical protein